MIFAASISFVRLLRKLVLKAYLMCTVGNSYELLCKRDGVPNHSCFLPCDQANSALRCTHKCDSTFQTSLPASSRTSLLFSLYYVALYPSFHNSLCRPSYRSQSHFIAHGPPAPMWSFLGSYSCRCTALRKKYFG